MFDLYALIGAALVMVMSIRREDKHRDIFVAGTLLFATVVSFPILTALTGRQHHTIDKYLYIADLRLHLDGWNLARFCHATHWTHALILECYWALPMCICLAWLAERNMTMVWAIGIAGMVSPVCFFLFPAIGPAHAFSGFPWSSPHIQAGQMTVYSHMPRNAFPSLHFAWALLIYINLRRKTFRTAAFGFVFLTAVATLATGEHYGIDLIGSIPLVIAVQWTAEKIPQIVEGRKKNSENGKPGLRIGTPVEYSTSKNGSYEHSKME